MGLPFVEYENENEPRPPRPGRLACRRGHAFFFHWGDDDVRKYPYDAGSGTDLAAGRLSWRIWQRPSLASLVGFTDGLRLASLSPHHLAAVAVEEAGPLTLELPSQRYGGRTHALQMHGPVDVASLLATVHMHYASTAPRDEVDRLLRLRRDYAGRGAGAGAGAERPGSVPDDESEPMAEDDLYASSAAASAIAARGWPSNLDLLGARPPPEWPLSAGGEGSGRVVYQGVVRVGPGRYLLLLGA